jgi:hypothetical protein
MFALVFLVTILFSSYKNDCVDMYTDALNNQSYTIECPTQILYIIPLSCSCGTYPVYRFSTYLGDWNFECFCNTDYALYGYARAFCCDSYISKMAFNKSHDHKISLLQKKLKNKEH